jgi:hypothetical protein
MYGLLVLDIWIEMFEIGIQDFLFTQARSAFERKDFQKAETFLLRAERPELAAKFYKVSYNNYCTCVHMYLI